MSGSVYRPERDHLFTELPRVPIFFFFLDVLSPSRSESRMNKRKKYFFFFFLRPIVDRRFGVLLFPYTGVSGGLITVVTA